MSQTVRPRDVEGTIRLAFRILLGAATLFAIVWSACTQVTREGQATLHLRFGRPVQVDTTAGLHLKAPWPIDSVVTIDLRRQVIESGHTEMLTHDKKNVLVMTYALWRVGDPILFHQAIGGMDRAAPALDGLLTNAAIGVMGRYDLSALTSTVATDLHVDEIEHALLTASAPLAKESYGIVIDRVAIMRLSLPEQNTSYVFNQMRAERKQYATRYTAEGDKEASRIRAETALEVSRIQAAATEEAARTRGDADAQAAKIYADAHRDDPELYRFTRSLETLQKVVGDKTTLLLRTDAEPFSLLKGQKP